MIFHEVANEVCRKLRIALLAVGFEKSTVDCNFLGVTKMPF